MNRMRTRLFVLRLAVCDLSTARHIRQCCASGFRSASEHLFEYTSDCQNIGLGNPYGKWK